MRWRRAVIALVIVAVSSGCASGIKYAEFAPKIPPQSSEVGRIFFYRTAVLGAALQPDVLLNGEKVGSAKPQGFFYVDRPPGEYRIETSTEVTRKVSFVLEKGQTRWVRLSVSMGFFVGHVYGELVEPEDGSTEIEDCRYTGNP